MPGDEGMIIEWSAGPALRMETRKHVLVGLSVTFADTVFGHDREKE